MRKTLLTLFVWLLLCALGRADDQANLVKQVQISNRAAVEAIHTLSCKATRSMTRANGQAEESPTEEHHHSGGNVRVRLRHGQDWTDVLVKDGVMYSMSNVRETFIPYKVLGHVARYRDTPIGMCDPMYESLFFLRAEVQNESRRVTFDEFMNKPHALRRAERVSEGSRELIVLRLEFAPDSWAEYYFDPSANYLMRKLKSSYVMPGSPSIKDSLTEVTRYREATPGIFFPEEVVKRVALNGKPTATIRAVFRDVRVNQPLPAGIFDFRFPKDAMVDNEIQGKRYRIGADGTQVGESEPMPNPPPPEGAVLRTETREEPLFWSLWILPASLALLGLTGAWWAFRKWRERV